jgi:hypothetical protein
MTATRLKPVVQRLNPTSSLLHAALFACACTFAVIPALASTASSGIRVQGPGVAPQLMFACCDHGVDQTRSLFADPQVIADLKDLHAGLAVAIPDFTPERAELVHRLNQAGIPVIAGLTMPPEQGFYFNAENAPEAAARFAAFDAWSREQGLRWDGVGLDIEPNFAELASPNGHWWRLFTTLLWRAVDVQRMHRAQRAYSALIANIRSRGYFVQTYQLPYLPVERKAHSSLLDRMLGTVDVRGDQEVLMLYTSYAGPAGTAIIWKLGPDAQAIAICCTDGDPAANPAVLDWSRFSRDLIVAGHFSHVVGVYDLEGCVRQGFLPRLKTMNWSQSVTIPAVAMQMANRRLRMLRLVLWISSHLLYLIAILLLAVALMVWRWRIRKGNKRKRSLSMQATAPTSHPQQPIAARSSRWQRIGPVVTLLLLAPIISELLYGAMRISVIFILIPEILTWGCGALLIRECVRRWTKGWQSMLLLGLALAVAEEWVIQQTSIAPFVAAHAYGRLWGVNWVYFLWALGFESVWVVLIPVQLTELLFPARRHERWMRTRGFVIASFGFVLGAFIAWYGWTQRARIMVFHMPPYSPPPLYLLIGVGAILLLILSAYALPSGRPGDDHAVPHSAPPPWLVGSVLCAMGLPWEASGSVVWGNRPLPIPFALVLVGGLLWATLTFFLVRRWTSSPDWRDAHRFALVFGGVLACILGGFVVFKAGGALRIDWIGKAVLNAAAIVWLLSLWRQRTAQRMI